MRTLMVLRVVPTKKELYNKEYSNFNELLIVCVANVQANDDISFDVSVDYFGKYIRRGQNISDAPVFQFGVSLGCGSSSYNNGYWTVVPGINYVTLLNNKIRETDTFNKASDYLFAGVSLSKSF